MPRYLIETTATSAADRDRVYRLAADRFPEVALEHRYAVGDERGGRDVWVCRATSETHVKRWAQAARLGLETLRKIETDAALCGETGGQP